jgi:hypothetical protein
VKGRVTLALLLCVGAVLAVLVLRTLGSDGRDVVSPSGGKTPSGSAEEPQVNVLGATNAEAIALLSRELEQHEERVKKLSTVPTSAGELRTGAQLAQLGAYREMGARLEETLGKLCAQGTPSEQELPSCEATS